MIQVHLTVLWSSVVNDAYAIDGCLLCEALSGKGTLDDDRDLARGLLGRHQHVDVRDQPSALACAAVALLLNGRAVTRSCRLPCLCPHRSRRHRYR